MTQQYLSVRLPAELAAELDTAATTGPYRIPRAQIVQRGIRMALDEMKARAPVAAPAKRGRK